MPLLGIGVVFMGYSLMYYGITQVRGGNWGLLDLVIPGKFDATIAMDSGSTGDGTTAGTKSGQVPAIVQTGPTSGQSYGGNVGAGITQTPPGQLYN